MGMALGWLVGAGEEEEGREGGRELRCLVGGERFGVSVLVLVLVLVLMVFGVGACVGSDGPRSWHSGDESQGRDSRDPRGGGGGDVGFGGKTQDTSRQASTSFYNKPVNLPARRAALASCTSSPATVCRGPLVYKVTVNPRLQSSYEVPSSTFHNPCTFWGRT